MTPNHQNLTNFMAKFIQTILIKLIQHPQFHSTTYTRMHKNKRHGQMLF